MRRTRRGILRLAGAGLATGALVATEQAQAAGIDRRAADELALLFADPGAAAAIGRAYLQGHNAARPDLAAMRAEMMHALQLPGGELGEYDRAALRAKFRGRIRQDFAEARTAMVDGWMLSRVEAQACAIAWLSGSGDR
jgi:hypothetical protein